MKAKTLLLIALFCFPVCIYAQTGNSGLDPAFGKGGILADTPFVNHLQVNDLALQPDGKIVVAGTFNAAVSRYLPNGNLDSSFAGTGFINGDILTNTGVGTATHVFLLSDGKILLTFSASIVSSDMAVRLKPDGSLDSSFGVAGRTTFCCYMVQAAMQPNGKLVMAGTNANGDVYVNRITQDGLIDNTFGTNGTSMVHVNTSSVNGGIEVSGIGVTKDGHIEIVGGNYRNLYCIRLDSNGARDSSFCGNGLCYGSFDIIYCRDAIVYPDGKALVALEGINDDSSFLARLKADGTPDSSFGLAGNGFLSVPGLRIITLLQMPDGRIICAGTWDEHFAIASVLKDGKGIDTTFGNRGIITTNVAGAHYERIYAVALQPDGKIVAGGTCDVPASGPQFWRTSAAIVRYLPNAMLGIMETPQQMLRGTLKVYPNPAKTSLIVVVPAPGLLQLFSIEGRLLKEQPCAGPVQDLDIVSLPAGTYLLRLQTTYKSYSSLFVKE